ncbi:hypothetical protein [Azonexus sp.]|nr:hypothetical protein [Azonexus sp.]
MASLNFNEERIDERKGMHFVVPELAVPVEAFAAMLGLPPV